MQQTINMAVQNNLNKLEKDCLMVNKRIEELLGEDATCVPAPLPAPLPAALPAAATGSLHAVPTTNPSTPPMTPPMLTCSPSPRRRSSRAHNRKAAFNGWLAFICSLLAPILVITLFLHRSGIVAEVASTAAVSPAMVSAFSQTCDAIVAPEQQQQQHDEGAAAPASSDGGSSSSSSSAAGLLSMKQFLVGALVLFIALQALSKSLRRYKPSYSKRELANLVATQRYVTVSQSTTKASQRRLQRPRHGCPADLLAPPPCLPCRFACQLACLSPCSLDDCSGARAVRLGAVRLGAVRLSAVRLSAVRLSAVRLSAVRPPLRLPSAACRWICSSSRRASTKSTSISAPTTQAACCERGCERTCCGVRKRRALAVTAAICRLQRLRWAKARVGGWQLRSLQQLGSNEILKDAPGIFRSGSAAPWLPG